MHTITQGDIHSTNRKNIYNYIYHGRIVKQKDIPHSLRISRPTVTAHLSAMENEGLIVRNTAENTDSQNLSAGRRPITWSLNSRYKIALGVEIMKDVVKIIAIDLYGFPLKWEKFTAEYENSPKYYGYISVKVEEFIASLEIDAPCAKILGIGFALQGLVSEDGSTVIYGEILKCTGLKIDVFAERLNYPCCFVHEPDGAALSELWLSPDLEDAVYLSMSEHLGGAFIFGRGVKNGMHRHSATFEHITACPGGELCYCGKNGCFETVCSKTALLKGDKPDEFFARVREGEPEASKRWRVFLEYLGRLIANLHLLYDTKYILGGHLAPYFTDDDIKFLYERVRERTPFEEDDDYILPSKMPSHNITVGAALPYIMRFLEHAPEI